MTTPSGICECGCGGQTEIATVTRSARGMFKGRPRRFCPGHKGHQIRPSKRMAAVPLPRPPAIADPALRADYEAALTRALDRARARMDAARPELRRRLEQPFTPTEWLRIMVPKQDAA